MAEKNKNFESVKLEESTFIREVKEKLARTPLVNLESELKKPEDTDIEDKSYVLPDGTIIELERDLRMKMGEILVR